jgi:CRP-like cAMP-binding protein
VPRTAPLTDFHSVSSIISQLRIFGGVTDEQLTTVFRHLELWILSAGEILFKKGDEPRHVYIIKSGRIDLNLTENSMIIHKHDLQVGECCGEASLMSMHQHTCTAIAAMESEVIVLSRNALIGLKHEDIHLFALLMMNLARELARRLYLTDQMLIEARAIHPKAG